MNAFEHIDQLEAVIKKNIQEKDQTQTITLEEHNKSMLNMLYIIKKCLGDAEYVFQAKRIGHEDYMTFGEYTVLYSHLADDLLLFQPMCSDGSFLSVDMSSIAEELGKLKQSGRIKEDMILLPPDVNVLRATLRKPDTPEEHDEENLPEEFK